MTTRALATVQAGDECAPVEVKILKKWYSHSSRPELCLLLVDKANTAIQAYVGPRESPTIESKVHLLSCYRITHYVSQPRRQKQRVVSHEASIHLGTATLFELIDDIGFPKFHFNFVPFEELASRLADQDSLIDFIGRLMYVKSDITTPSNRRLLKLQIEDISEQTVEVALWTEIAKQVDKHFLLTAPFPTTIAFSSMKVDSFGGLQLASTPATQLYINPQIEEAINIGARFEQNYNEVTVNLRSRISIDALLQLNQLTQEVENPASRRNRAIAFLQLKTGHQDSEISCSRVKPDKKLPNQ